MIGGSVEINEIAVRLVSCYQASLIERVAELVEIYSLDQN